ncbi:hypothetical protein WMF38_57245 [Sorangium sp. So ce118]
MNDPSNKPTARPSDVRSISDPPDMGRLRPAEEAAKEMVTLRQDGIVVDGQEDAFVVNWQPNHQRGTLNKVERVLAGIIRQSRAEGAAEALEGAASFIATKVGEHDALADCAEPHEAASGYHAGKSEAYSEAAAILRARAKGIINPPDMG